MSNVSIYDKNWLDLVFEGKNKEYGAYQLRQENSRTTLMAFLMGIGFFAAIAGVATLSSSFTSADSVISKPKILDKTIHVVKVIIEPKKEEPKKQKFILPLKKEKTTEKVTTKNLVNPIIVKKDERPDEITENKKSQPDPEVKGTATIGTAIPVTPNEGTGTKEKGTATGKTPSSITTTNDLDKLPEFPGGIKAFQRYLVDNIDKPETDSENNAVSVIMSFVIEKDGSMTDIKVLRSSDKEFEQAAIKVLKSLKARWSPGMKDGEKMRTLFVQPIRVVF